MTKITLNCRLGYKLEPDTWAREHCKTYLGTSFHFNENGAYDFTVTDYCFKNNADAVLFVLRWS